MSLTLINEEYDGLPSLYANAGDWVDGQLKFYTRFDYTSNLTAKATYNSVAGNFSITLPVGDSWDKYGFAVGDAIVLTSLWVYFDAGLGGTFSNAQSWARNILYLSGNVMQIDAHLVAVPGGGTPPTVEVANGREFPTDSITSRFTDLTIVKAAAADEIEFNFNLTPNGSTSLNSVIDGELMRFTSSGIGSMSLLGTIPLVQIGNESGGYIKDVQLTWDLHDVPNSWRTYTVTYKILQWGVIQNGVSEPTYYDGTDHLAPIANIKLLGQTGNPNTALQITSQNTEADTGGFNENFNGGNNPNALISIQWTDFLGNPIDGMDYSNESTFEAQIYAPGQVIGSSTFRIGMVFRPTDGAVYQSSPLSIARNLLVNAPEVDFLHSAIPDPTTYAGFPNGSGAQLNITDLEFFIAGAGITVRGKVIPIGSSISYFSPFPDGTRKMSMWVSIGNHLTDGTDLSERVNLLINDSDIIDAPTLGVQIPDIDNTIILDHGDYDAVFTPGYDSTITTEDDAKYRADFSLLDNIDYEGIRIKVSAFNTVSLDEFTLEEVLFSFASVANIAGQFQPNIILPRNFNLPPTTDKNEVSLIRLPGLDVAGKYGLRASYGFLSRWEYWLEQSNADNDFYDISQDWDGKNKNWQRFSTGANWVLRFSLFTIVDGVEDFDYHTFNIRPYEDANLTTVVTYTRLSDGTNPTSLVDDELMEVEAALTWNDPQNFSVNSWAEATVEDYESGNRWVISSILPQGGVSANPLEPIAGAVGLDVQLAGNVATMKFIIDTNKINVNKVSMSYRIFSEETIGGKQKTDGTNKQTTTGDNKLKS